MRAGSGSFGFDGGFPMASFRTIATLTLVTAACIVGTMSGAAAETMRPAPTLAATSTGFARCPKSPDQYVDVMKQLISSAARARALADENPLLEPDAAFYESELASTRKCVPAVASLMPR
jgi:hypothetical protein